MCDGRTGDGVCMGAMAGGEAYEANSLHTRMFSFHVLASTRVLASPSESCRVLPSPSESCRVHES